MHSSFETLFSIPRNTTETQVMGKEASVSFVFYSFWFQERAG
jgi:hypothetical protein